MTAIYGIWRHGGEDVTAGARLLEDALAAFGKDASECWSGESGLVIGRRLHRSLFEDCAEKTDEVGRYVVMGDVRLTERTSLIDQLALGEEARSMSDSAIAARAIECWHENAFDRLYGAFAIAAWDRVQKRLLLARDHLGLKPLFFHRSKDFFAFASMPVGLRALPDVPRGADVDSLKRFLILEPLAPGRTHYEGICRVMPGHYATLTADRIVSTRYWNPDLNPIRLPSADDYADALSRELDRAVASALRGAGQEVAALLSSGFDSTAVAATAAVQLARDGKRLVAYTAAPREGFAETVPNLNADESVLAGATAAMHPNIEHVVVRSERSPLDNLGRTSSIYGGPILNLCNERWFDEINDAAAARGIRIMLEGAMGNATISETGMLALPELVSAGRGLSWLKLARLLTARGVTSWRSILWHSFRHMLPNGLYRWLSEKRGVEVAQHSRWSSLRQVHAAATVRDAALERPRSRTRSRAVAGGFVRPSESGLEERLALIAADDPGAAYKGMLAEWGIDYRDPTADRRLVELSLRVPTEQLIQGGQPRALLRKVLADKVPREVLDNRRSGYQSADWHEGFNRARPAIAEEIARMEMSETASQIIDVESLKTLVDTWPAASDRGYWNGSDAIYDYRCRLLRAISAASFIRHASGSNH